MSKSFPIWRRPLFLGACLVAFGSACGSSTSGTPAGTGGASTPAASSGGSPGQQSGSGGATQPTSSGGATQPTSSGGATQVASGGAPGSGGQGTGGGVVAGTGGATTGTGGGVTGGGGGPSGNGGKPATTGGGGAGTSNNPIAAGGDSKCASTTAAIGKLCDGFEGPAPGTPGSSMMFALTGATGVVDTTKPYRGKNSVHIKTMTGMGYITETATFDQAGTVATNNEMWGRIFIWFATTANPQSHDVFITLEDPALAGMSKELHLAGGSRGFLASQIRTTSDLYHPPMGTGMIKFPANTMAWHCWEWHTTAANTLDFYIDGAIYGPMSVVAADKWPFPTFKKLSLGFMEFGGTPATELWIDEVAVDTARIGCDN